MKRVILITGGQRSGKSRLACRIASMFSDDVTFIATAEARDDEMRARIEEHRKNRPPEWKTVEEPLRPAGALERCATDVAIVDCLTLWLSNVVHGNPGSPPENVEKKVMRELRGALNAAARKNMTLIAVTNEIGMGVIPSSPSVRRFVELQGTLNQAAAEAADVAIGMMSGQPVILKGKSIRGRVMAPCLAPFRIGATSFVHPADVETNARLLAGRVEDVEMVVFESAEISAYPTEEEVDRLCVRASREGFTWTVHFPLNAGIAHPDREKREKAAAEWKGLFRRVRPLLPLACVAHVPLETEDETAEGWKTLDEAALKRWQGRAAEQLERLKGEGVETEIFCFENLDYPMEYLEPVMEAAGGGLCLDAGHVAAWGKEDLLAAAERYFDRIRAVHLHRHDGKWDHRALSDPLDDEHRRLVQFLMRNDFSGVVTLEVFSEDDLARSLSAMKNFLLLR
ncbi:MAG: cobamide remodeling phosphodiesterase CbiR [bacterium]